VEKTGKTIKLNFTILDLRVAIRGSQGFEHSSCYVADPQ
jgi:hypothetical protein